MPRTILAAAVIGIVATGAGSLHAATIHATGPTAISPGDPLTLSIHVAGSEPASGFRLVVDTGPGGPPVIEIALHHDDMVFEDAPGDPTYYDEFATDLAPPSPYTREIYTWEPDEPEPWPTRPLDGLLATVALDTSALQAGTYTIRFEYPELNDSSAFAAATFDELPHAVGSTPFQFQVHVNGVPEPGVLAQLVGLAGSAMTMAAFRLRRGHWMKLRRSSASR
jgi:hypothetical protein